jgi:hypothetical protein
MVRVTVAVGFTEADIQRAAGPRSFGRGLEYVDEVDDLEISNAQVTATVYGTHEYRVTLTIGSGQLTGTCTCPQGQEGAFCKHCVATGLTVLGDPPSALNAGGTSARSWLESLPRDELLAELLDLMADEPEVQRRFELRAAAGHADAAVIRRAVRELVEVADYIEFDQAWSYAHDVSKAADAIASLIDTGAAGQAVGIAREAIALLTGAMESVDDSSGNIGDSARELLAVHLRACQAAKPDPVALADYITGLALHDDYGFAPDLADYAGLLGDTGQARARERASAAFTESPQNYRARRLMEAIFKAEGDADGLISVYSHELDNHGRIARTLDEAGRHDEALDWALSGTAAGRYRVRHVGR